MIILGCINLLCFVIGYMVGRGHIRKIVETIQKDNKTVIKTTYTEKVTILSDLAIQYISVGLIIGSIISFIIYKSA